MKRLILSILFTAIFNIFHSPCTAQYLKVQDSKDKRIIDLDKAKYPDTPLLASTQFKSVKIIPLETNESSLLAGISKIRVIDSFILVLNIHNNTNSLYVFDKEGRFIRQIGRVGQGPGDYVQIFDFTIDRDSKTVYIKDGTRLHKYDIASGKFIQTIWLEYNPESPRASCIEFIGDKIYAYSSYFEHSTKNCLLFSIDESSGKEINHFLNVMEYNKGISNKHGHTAPNNTFYSRENGDVIFVQPFMNHIIEITKDGVFSLLELKGKNMLTSGEAKKVHELSEIRNKPPQILEISQIEKYLRIARFFEKGDEIFIDMAIGMTIHFIVINKRTNEVCVYKSYFDDVLYQSLEGSILYSFGCSDSHGVYITTSNSRNNIVPELQEFYKKGAYSPDVIGLEKIMELAEDDNPVLFYYEF